MSRDEIILIYNWSPYVIVKLLENLLSVISIQSSKIEEQEKAICALKGRIRELEDERAKNSRNSSKPPSSDGVKREATKSMRKSSGSGVGGQKGHKGNTLQMVDNPDKVVLHRVAQCKNCGLSLERSEAKDYERRQVFDIPPLVLEVTEYQAEIKNCPNCGTRNKGDFVQDVQNPVQYGKRLKSLFVYLTNYQLLPYERTSELIRDLFSHSLSQATLVNTNNLCYKLLEGVEKEIKKQLTNSPVINCDETGLYNNGKRQWLHVVSTPNLTHYAFHQKRGKKATEDMDILPHFKGTAVHDFWKPYYNYSCNHGLCNAHHLRELTFLYEQYNQQWAKKMIYLLLEIKEKVAQEKLYSDGLDKRTINEFGEKYKRIIEEGHKANPPPKAQPRKRGRNKQSRSKNLLDRLDIHRKEVLAFMYDFKVPFDNNLAERDLRMMKVQQKISGAFRSDSGVRSFCRIRSYISTVKKQGRNVIEAIQDVF